MVLTVDGGSCGEKVRRRGVCAAGEVDGERLVTLEGALLLCCAGAVLGREGEERQAERSSCCL